MIRLRLCGWHEAGQESLPGFTVSHGICLYCRTNIYFAMKRPVPYWHLLMNEYGWKTINSGGYFRTIQWTAGNGDIYEVVHVESEILYTVFRNNIYAGIEGTLTQCILASMKAGGSHPSDEKCLFPTAPHTEPPAESELQNHKTEAEEHSQTEPAHDDGQTDLFQ